MKYIEIFGPPGVGKSTLHSRLITSSELFGGTDEDATRRMLYKKIGRPYRSVYRLVPPPIRRMFEDEFLEYRLGHSVFEDFLREYPEFVDTVADAMDSVAHEPERVFSLCKRSAERYQLGVATADGKETLCIDEGFAQRAFSILWREQDSTFSLEQYFRTVPMPDTVIYVDAPVEVCLDRQRARGRMPVSKSWETDSQKQTQIKLQNLCLRIRNYLNKETSVLTVENTHSIKNSIHQVFNSSHMNVKNSNFH